MSEDRLVQLQLLLLPARDKHILSLQQKFRDWTLSYCRGVNVSQDQRQELEKRVNDWPPMAAPSEEYKTVDMDREQLLEVVREKDEQITKIKQWMPFGQLRELGFSLCGSTLNVGDKAFRCQ